jgi:hypothetical protein
LLEGKSVDFGHVEVVAGIWVVYDTPLAAGAIDKRVQQVAVGISVLALCEADGGIGI